jgi:hypothetical protein
MAITNIPVIEAPFQSVPELVGMDLKAGVNITTLASGKVIAAASEMSFVNSGYTVLFVTLAATASNMTITTVDDNADRTGTYTPIVLTTNATTAIGPLRPIWFNDAGRVFISFSSVTDVKVCAVNFQF